MYIMQDDVLLRAMWNNAAKEGFLTVIYSLHDSGFSGCTTDTMDYAAMAGNIHILHFLFIHRNEFCSPKAMNWACTYGHLETVKFLYTFLRDFCNIKEAIIIADMYCHKDIALFLKTQTELYNKRKQKRVTFAELSSNKKIKIN